MENKSYLMITENQVKINPTIEDEFHNPGAVIIMYSYFDKFTDDYFYLMPEKFVREFITNDLKDYDLYNQNEKVVEVLMWHIMKFFDDVAI